MTTGFSPRTQVDSRRGDHMQKAVTSGSRLPPARASERSTDAGATTETGKSPDPTSDMRQALMKLFRSL